MDQIAEIVTDQGLSMPTSRRQETTTQCISGRGAPRRLNVLGFCREAIVTMVRTLGAPDATLVFAQVDPLPVGKLLRPSFDQPGVAPLLDDVSLGNALFVIILDGGGAQGETTVIDTSNLGTGAQGLLREALGLGSTASMPTTIEIDGDIGLFTRWTPSSSNSLGQAVNGSGLTLPGSSSPIDFTGSVLVETLDDFMNNRDPNIASAYMEGSVAMTQPSISPIPGVPIQLNLTQTRLGLATTIAEPPGIYSQIGLSTTLGGRALQAAGRFRSSIPFNSNFRQIEAELTGAWTQPWGLPFSITQGRIAADGGGVTVSGEAQMTNVNALRALFSFSTSNTANFIFEIEDPNITGVLSSLGINVSLHSSLPALQRTTVTGQVNAQGALTGWSITAELGQYTANSVTLQDASVRLSSGGSQSVQGRMTVGSSEVDVSVEISGSQLDFVASANAVPLRDVAAWIQSEVGDPIPNSDEPGADLILRDLEMSFRLGSTSSVDLTASMTLFGTHFDAALAARRRRGSYGTFLALRAADLNLSNLGGPNVDLECATVGIGMGNISRVGSSSFFGGLHGCASISAASNIWLSGSFDPTTLVSDRILQAGNVGNLSNLDVNARIQSIFSARPQFAVSVGMGFNPRGAITNSSLQLFVESNSQGVTAGLRGTMTLLVQGDSLVFDGEALVSNSASSKFSASLVTPGPNWTTPFDLQSLSIGGASLALEFSAVDFGFDLDIQGSVGIEDVELEVGATLDAATFLPTTWTFRTDATLESSDILRLVRVDPPTQFLNLTFGPTNKTSCRANAATGCLQVIGDFPNSSGSISGKATLTVSGQVILNGTIDGTVSASQVAFTGQVRAAGNHELDVDFELGRNGLRGNTSININIETPWIPIDFVSLNGSLVITSRQVSGDLSGNWTDGSGPDKILGSLSLGRDGIEGCVHLPRLGLQCAPPVQEVEWNADTRTVVPQTSFEAFTLQEIASTNTGTLEGVRVLRFRVPTPSGLTIRYLQINGLSLLDAASSASSPNTPITIGPNLLELSLEPGGLSPLAPERFFEIVQKEGDTTVAYLRSSFRGTYFDWDDPWNAFSVDIDADGSNEVKFRTTSGGLNLLNRTGQCLVLPGQTGCAVLTVNRAIDSGTGEEAPVGRIMASYGGNTHHRVKVGVGGGRFLYFVGSGLFASNGPSAAEEFDLIRMGEGQYALRTIRGNFVEFNGSGFVESSNDLVTNAARFDVARCADVAGQSCTTEDEMLLSVPGQGYLTVNALTLQVRVGSTGTKMVFFDQTELD